MLSKIFQLTITWALILNLVSVTSCTTSTPQNQSIQSPSKQQKQLVGSRINNQDTIRAFNRLRTTGLRDHEDIDLNTLEPGEVCIISQNEGEARELDTFADAQGYIKKKRRKLGGLGFVMSILLVPSKQTVQQGIMTLRAAFPSQIIDANHHYFPQGQTVPKDPRLYGHRLVGWDEHTMSCTTQNVPVGMIDTPVDRKRLLTRRPIQAESFLSDTVPNAPDHHGTAVAALLIGQTQPTSHALLPHASLFVAEAFRQTDSGNTEATTWSIVRALNWLVEQQVQVINLSLGGPPNALLSYAINITLDQGIPIIAAGGNAGPHGPSIYPAAEPGVIAVTALDADLHPYRHASQGSYITFSAPGVDIWIPNGGGDGTFQSGTSFATPFVTTAAATIKGLHANWTPEQVSHHLATHALDLGERGKDRIFGWGLVQIPETCKANHPSFNLPS